MWQRKALFFILQAVIFSLVGACSGKIEGNLRRDSSAEFHLEIALMPRMGAMLRSLSALGSRAPADRAAPVINGPAIARSMAAAPGILSVELENTGPEGVAGTIRVSRVDDLFAVAGAPARKRFITLETRGGEGRLSVLLDREIAPRLLAMISADVRDYLSALFAPAATGDPLSKAEYLELVGDIYGRALADEIASAKIAVTMGFPGPVRSVKGGTYRGASAFFALPLTDFLVLEDPLEYEIVWSHAP